jgi:4'-phosphopantetheinyl transferase
MAEARAFADPTPGRGAQGLDGARSLPPDGSVDIWLLQLVAHRLEPHDIRLLSDDERRRGAADPAFALARAQLRRLLGHYLDVAPALLRLKYGPMGRPELDGHALSFSVSRRAGMALIAIAAMGRIGIDLERRGPLAELDAICAMLHPVEQARLAGLPAHARAALFYRIWTRKEAAAKALGRGLPDSLSALCVLGPDDGREGDPGRCEIPGSAPLFLHDLSLPASFSGALACEAAVEIINSRRFPLTADMLPGGDR